MCAHYDLWSTPGLRQHTGQAERRATVALRQKRQKRVTSVIKPGLLPSLSLFFSLQFLHFSKISCNLHNNYAPNLDIIRLVALFLYYGPICHCPTPIALHRLRLGTFNGGDVLHLSTNALRHVSAFDPSILFTFFWTQACLARLAAAPSILFLHEAILFFQQHNHASPETQVGSRSQRCRHPQVRLVQAGSPYHVAPIHSDNDTTLVEDSALRIVF